MRGGCRDDRGGCGEDAGRMQGGCGEHAGRMRGGPGRMRGGPGTMRGGSGRMRGGPGRMRGGPGRMQEGCGEDAGRIGEDAGRMRGECGEDAGRMRGGPGRMRGGPGRMRGGSGRMRGGPGEILGRFGEDAGWTMPPPPLPVSNECLVHHIFWDKSNSVPDLGTELSTLPPHPPAMGGPVTLTFLANLCVLVPCIRVDSLFRHKCMPQAIVSSTTLAAGLSHCQQLSLCPHPLDLSSSTFNTGVRSMLGMPFTQCKVLYGGKYSNPSFVPLVEHLTQHARRVRGAEIGPSGPPKHPEFLPWGPIVL